MKNLYRIHLLTLLVLIATGGPGLAKEVIDNQEKDNHFSRGDMAANLGGSLVGALLGNWLNNTYWAQIEAGKERIGLTIGRSF